MIIAATALVAFSAFAAEEDPDMPLKYRNASPEIRAAAGYPPKPEEPKIDIERLRGVAGGDEPHCASVKVSAPVKFRNRTLVEIPDITEPALRLANQLMSSGCFKRAFDQLETVVRADPGNIHAKYVMARMAWMRFGLKVAAPLLEKTVAEHPDFASATVLLAGVRFAQEKLAESAALLRAVEPRSPTDMWIYLGRLRIEAFGDPSEDLRVRLLEITRSTAFPPNAREAAAEAAQLLPQSSKQYEEILWAKLDIESNRGIACKAHDLAFWLSEGDEDRFAEVIKLLESPRAQRGDCLGLMENRTLLAQAYLMEAAKLSAGPSRANQHLIDRVDELLNGDYTSVAAHAQSRPQYAVLRPFLQAFVHPDETDHNGVTNLCHAIGQLDVALVREHLEAGADPNGRCRHESLVGSLIYMATREQDEQRRDIMRALLEHGATVTNIDACRSPTMGDCAQVLLPVMEQYVKKR